MSKTYFNHLNYTLGNEDTSLEYGLLKKNTNHIFSIAGSGSRILPLLAKRPKRITCVDMSLEQLYLTELRIESLRALEHEEFLAFWGYPPKTMTTQERKKAFLKIHLSIHASKFLRQLFENNKWDTLLYTGRWEKTFATLSKINRIITGKKGAQLFTYKTTSGYNHFLHTQFPQKAWALIVFFLGNAAVFNSLLYKGNFPKKNISGSLYQFYMHSFTRLFNQGPARNNFFLQILFFGKLLFPEGNPIECDKTIFTSAKKGLKTTTLSYIQGDLITEAVKINKPIDFFSFSDVPSYFAGRREKTFLQEIHSHLSPSAIVVMRNYLRIPEYTIMRGYEDITETYTELINKEKMQMYTIQILRKKE